MYERKNKGWMKHLDFMVVDIICLQTAFVLAYNVRFGIANPYKDVEYLNLAIIFLLIDFCAAIIFESFKNVLKRDWYEEFACVLKHVFLVEGLTLCYLFTTQKGQIYSRISFYLMIPLYIGITCLGRSLWKKRLKKGKRYGACKSLVIIAPGEKLAECIDNICNTNYNTYFFVGAVAADVSLKGQVIHDVPIVADYEDVVDYVSREWVDEVFISYVFEHGYPMELIEKLNRMGVIVHIAITKAGDIKENKRQIERLGNYTVLTNFMNCATPTQLFLKRLMDIGGSLAGCLVTLFLIIVVGPLIYISSPGPIFFSQERVGRNGKKFKMYKFRTMYLDAEERKKELSALNQMDGGMMFKLDFDPRIIGNRRLGDGTIKSGIGSFLRRTSLDEFPQMFNILRGDMSLVGTRPPTMDEWIKYEGHHRARLAFKPGLTGLWQVSGRSNITDFEEVVKLDTRYIDEWSLGLDIRILLKTVKVVLRGEGAR